MDRCQKYRKKSNTPVHAVQLNLDTDGFKYQKWGAQQFCKAGDWIVYNNGNTYTIDQQSFSETYNLQSPGLYVKTAAVWAKQAVEAGFIETKEGKSQYQPGDYLVYNNQDGSDGYCIKKDNFESMYELDLVSTT